MSNYRFAALLRELMERDGRNLNQVAKAAGRTRDTALQWLEERTYPTGDVAERLADYFNYNGLVGALSADKRRRCLECHRQFQQFSKRANYCSDRCKVRGSQRRSRKTISNRELMIVRRERDELRKAVDANCRSCEHDCVCKDPTCEFQRMGLSPFPLIQLQRRAG